MCYGAVMTVAELIEKLKSLPQDLPVISTEEGNWGDPEPHVLEAGEPYDGRRFEERTVVI